MNAVEIEEAVSELASEPFDPAEFAFRFLAAFGNKKTTIDRLRKGSTNQSDVSAGILQRSNIHIATCEPGEVDGALTALRESPKTGQHKAKFILATDGETLQAEDLASGETVVSDFEKFPDKFAFFLPLAGISTVKQVRENAFDIRATSRLNKLYVELLKDNPDWAERRPDMNHFMARLIFCCFAEDTDIFHGSYRFTPTIERMSETGAGQGDFGNTHEIIETLFRAMNTKSDDKAKAELPRWASGFPYVNGELFSGSTDVPRFSRIARSYLIHIGNLDWTKINPDIFGSMIQAVADDEERGALGMHYTSVPNILKVLNPLFLDDLRAKLEEAGDNGRKLLNLRARMAKIRVFDPACGSGNFLVIAYKEMRKIEAELNRRRGESDRKTDIPLTNFRGIELRDFPAEIARLALIIAEYQCDVLYRGQKEALAEFLPLDSENWITCGNALRLDWLSICPPTGTGVKVRGDDLFETPLDQSEIDFENADGETYLCGNPPYVGSTVQAPKGANAETKARLKKEAEARKADLEPLFSHLTTAWKSLDYVSGWFMKFAEYARHTFAKCAFVATNSICQGEQVARLWPLLLRNGQKIDFAHTSFKWKNLAARNAGVSVVIIGLSHQPIGSRTLYSLDDDGADIRQDVANINTYLVANDDIVVAASTAPLSDVQPMTIGNKPVDGGHLIFSSAEAQDLVLDGAAEFIRPYMGAEEAINGKRRYCLWLDQSKVSKAKEIASVRSRLAGVEAFRKASSKELTQRGASTPFEFQQVRQNGSEAISIVPSVSSENREYLPVSLEEKGTIVSNAAFAVLDPELWMLSILVSRIHLVWIATVCGKLETRYRYSNTLGWNTFPLPRLTEQNKADLTRCAENILIARESHFPATIADLYDPEAMPEDLRRAHEDNDEVLERIYIGRRFRNDTERLEKLFELYTKMTGKQAA